MHEDETNSAPSPEPSPELSPEPSPELAAVVKALIDSGLFEKPTAQSAAKNVEDLIKGFRDAHGRARRAQLGIVAARAALATTEE